MIWQMSWRNIWRNRRRTAVILAAVVIGVWAMIFLGALMRGIADQMVRNGIKTLTGHLQVQAEGFRSDPVIENRIRKPGRVLAAMQSLPSGAFWAPRLQVSGVAANARHSEGITLVGIDPAREAKVSFIGGAVKAGRYLNEHDPDAILVGKALLERFETRPGHKLVLMAQNATGKIASRAFRITGVYRAELESTEKQFVFITLPAAQSMLGVDHDLSEVAVLLSARSQVAPVAAELARRLPGLVVLTWQQLLPLVSAVLKMYDGFILFWFLAVFLAMAFGLVNTILMAVFERVREFGLLRALGMKPQLVVAEVLAESFFLLVLGTAAGNLLAFLAIRGLSGSGIDLSAFAAGLEYAGMGRVIYPVLLARDMIVANLTVFVLGLLVSIYPAVKAARFSPVEAMARQ
ncbi:MAG: ABC transporter permease [Deltaproteobacteria bacterium]|jgi:ABC-type lipoprotein release transport system permease subunit